MKGRRWTQDEVKYLKEYSEVGDEYLAKKLNRIVYSVRDKRYTLNIKSSQNGVFMPESLSGQEKVARIYKMAADLGIKLRG